MSETPSFSRYQEATKVIESIEDTKLRAVLEYALTTVLVRRGMDPAIGATSEFDLRYFLEAVKAMFDNEIVVRAIIDGKDQAFRW